MVGISLSSELDSDSQMSYGPNILSALQTVFDKMVAICTDFKCIPGAILNPDNL